MTTYPPVFHAEHVGSLLRPGRLRHAHRDFAEGRISAERLGAIRDQAIRDVVALQERVGLGAVTDGEFRRASYWSHFIDAIDGFTVKPAVYHFRGASGARHEFLAPHAKGKIRRDVSISGGEFDFLKGLTDRVSKITMPSPPTMHFWRGGQAVDRRAYPDPEVFFTDLAAVYRAEIDDLGARGARYLQIDEVPLAMLCDPAVREAVAATGENPDQLIERYIALINAAVGHRPEGVTMAMHLCRGNFKGRWLSEGGYEQVAERLFNGIDVDAFFLEFDSPRAGGFNPLRFVPAGKRVVLGLVSTKTPELETKDQLKRWVGEASRYMPLERLAISPQCGFASTVAGNPVSEDDEARKLSLIVETAAEIWD